MFQMTSPIESLPIDQQANPFLTSLLNGFEYLLEYFTSALFLFAHPCLTLNPSFLITNNQIKTNQANKPCAYNQPNILTFELQRQIYFDYYREIPLQTQEGQILRFESGLNVVSSFGLANLAKTWEPQHGIESLPVLMVYSLINIDCFIAKKDQTQKSQSILVALLVRMPRLSLRTCKMFLSLLFMEYFLSAIF